jgi:hypothetical protein
VHGRRRLFFGSDVDISAGRAIVAELRDADEGNIAGTAHIYELDRTGWRHLAKLLPHVGFTGYGFGSAVGIDGARAVAGASGYFVDDVQTGVAFAYSSVDGDWRPTAAMVASDRALSDLFGVSVDISETTAVVGSLPIVNDDIESPGAVYVYAVPRN